MNKKNYVFIRLRRNDFNTRVVYKKKEILLEDGTKKEIMQKITYKSVQDQREHDDRREEIEEGYLTTSPDFEDIYLKSEKLNSKNHKDYFSSEWEKSKVKYKDFHKRGVHSKTKPFLTGLIGFSQVDKKDFENLKKVILSFLQKKFGNSLLYLTIHIDEKTPHFHFTVVNFNEITNKSFSKNIDTSLLQTELADFLQKDKDLSNKWIRGKLNSNNVHEEVKESKQKEKTNILNQREKTLLEKSKILDLKERELTDKEKTLWEKRNLLKKKFEEFEEQEKTLWKKRDILKKKFEELEIREQDYKNRLKVVIERETNVKDQKTIKNISIYTNRVLDARKELNKEKAQKNQLLIQQNLNKLSTNVKNEVKEIIHQYLE